MHLIASKFDENKIILVFIDLQRAFDIVDLNVMISKLCGMEIRGFAYKVLKSYLFGRCFHTVVNRKQSTTATLRVPQGSMLVPFLFLLHVHSLKHTYL